MVEFINREMELEALESMQSSDKAELLVVYGRRRVGKTELLKRFFRDKKHIYFLGDMQKEEKLLEIFSKIAQKAEGKEYLEFRNWDVFFKYLKEVSKERIIIVFDEVGYINKANKAFYSILQRYWDEELRGTKIFMILCGSSISMMEKEVLGYGSPLYGRRTGQFELKPLLYRDTRKFFPKLSENKKIEFYSILGGIPAYLNEVDGTRDIYWNIENNIANPNKFLYKEPRFILLEELRDPTTYFTILLAISQGATKFNEISQKSYVEPNKLSKYLQVLLNLRLIDKIIPVTHKKESRRSTLYRIRDNFFGFWFRYINPSSSLVEEGNIGPILDHIKADLAQYVSKIFEDVCREVLVELGKDGTVFPSFTKVGTWWEKGHEIDIAALNERTREILFGECKWSESKVKEDAVKKLVNKGNLVKWSEPKKKEHFVFFSKGGYTGSAKKYAVDHDVKLFDLKDVRNVFHKKEQGAQIP